MGQVLSSPSRGRGLRQQAVSFDADVYIADVYIGINSTQSVLKPSARLHAGMHGGDGQGTVHALCTLVREIDDLLHHLL